MPNFLNMPSSYMGIVRDAIEEGEIWFDEQLIGNYSPSDPLNISLLPDEETHRTIGLNLNKDNFGAVPDGNTVLDNTRHFSGEEIANIINVTNESEFLINDIQRELQSYYVHLNRPTYMLSRARPVQEEQNIIPHPVNVGTPMEYSHFSREDLGLAEREPFVSRTLQDNIISHVSPTPFPVPKRGIFYQQFNFLDDAPLESDLRPSKTLWDYLLED
jgi:hypothetical protein